MNCVCSSCIEHVTTPSFNLWVLDFARALYEGRVEHIGNTPDGRPIYRQVS